MFITIVFLAVIVIDLSEMLPKFISSQELSKGKGGKTVFQNIAMNSKEYSDHLYSQKEIRLEEGMLSIQKSTKSQGNLSMPDQHEGRLSVSLNVNKGKNNK